MVSFQYQKINKFKPIFITYKIFLCAENLFSGKHWPSVYSDSSDSEGAVAVFNYDSKYLIELQKVPSTATRQEIRVFLNNMEILNGLNGIHFLVESNDQKDGQVFVQLENLKDFQTALKLNNKCLDGVFIEGSRILFEIIGKKILVI